jgi:RNA polymerase sigma-70 factor, ECF subfamily
MSSLQNVSLCDLFAADYDELFKRLIRRFGSREFTFEVLQETYLRIEGVKDAAHVNSPRDYFFRAALNVAKNRRKVELRRLDKQEVEAFFDIPDEMPDPERVADGRSQIAILKVVFAELSKRQRLVLNGVALGGTSTQDLARQLKVSTRTVESDLRRAMEHCAKRLQRDLPKRKGGPRPKV